MWSSLQTIIKQFPRERFIIVEDGAPRYVVLSVEAYQELLEGKNHESPLSHIEDKNEQETSKHDAEQINSALQEVAAEVQSAQQEISAHEERAHVKEPMFAPDLSESEAIGYKSQASEVVVPERQREFRSIAVSIDDLPL